MAKKPARVALPKPHSEGQAEVLNHPGHGVLFAGRRWGKTDVATVRLITRVASEPGLYWWIGLSWRSASTKRAWGLLKGYTRDIWRAVGQRPDQYIRESDKELHFPGGGRIWLRTAERQESLAGEGVRGVAMDEFSLMPETVWTEYVAPTLIDYGGWALFLGVPKGLNWASRLWYAAKEKPNWKAWSFTSYDNPYLKKSAIDEMAANLPERLVRQEIMAEIVDDAGAVFRNVSELATATEQRRPIEGHTYTVGVDWARTTDATVFAVLDTSTKELCYLDRMVGVDYETQVTRLMGLNRRFRPSTIYAEQNSMGGPLVERLQREGLPVRPFMTTNASKQSLIDALVMAFEKEEVRILPDETLVNELMAYEMEQTARGALKFGAPTGMHDDTVMALALAWKGTGGYTWLI
jgi:hypothetical protein